VLVPCALRAPAPVNLGYKGFVSFNRQPRSLTIIQAHQMTLRYPLLIALILIHLPAFAEPSKKSEDIKAIVEITGIQTWFHERSEARFARARNLVDKANEVIAPHIKSLTPEQREILDRIIDRYIQSVQQASSPDEQLRIWTAAYGASISEQEAHQIRLFYYSPLGQALLRSTSAASNALLEFQSKTSDRAIETAYQIFMVDLEQIISTRK